MARDSAARFGGAGNGDDADEVDMVDGDGVSESEGEGAGGAAAEEAAFPSLAPGATALHEAARGLSLCCVRVLTLTDAPAVLGALLATRWEPWPLQQHAHPRLHPNPHTQAQAQTLAPQGSSAFFAALAAIAARDDDCGGRERGADEGRDAGDDEALLHDLCAATGLCAPPPAPPPALAPSSMPADGAGGDVGAAPRAASLAASARGDDGRGNRTGRHSQRTRVFVRDAAGRTPLGLAAAAALREHARGAAAGVGAAERDRRLRHAAAVVRLIYKMEALESWMIRVGGGRSATSRRTRDASDEDSTGEVAQE